MSGAGERSSGVPLARGASLLFVRLKSLGDILLSLPLAAELKRLRPDLSIDYLVDERFSGVAALSRAVRVEIARPKGWGGRAALMARLRGRYELAIDLHGSPASTLLARVASRGLVLGFPGKRLGFLYAARVPAPSPSDHTVAMNLEFLRLLGIDPPGKPAWDLDHSRLAPSSERADVVIHPGGRFAHKLWPGERFRELADRFAARGRRVTVLEGPEDDVPEILRKFPVASGLAIRDLFSLLSGARLFVGNDSGPMHVAASLGIPTIGLFGPSDSARWRPFGARARAVVGRCRCGAGSRGPCAFPEAWCMGGISVDDVMRAAEEANAPA